MLTEKMKYVQDLMNKKYTYESDGKIDSWHILDTDETSIKGDCDDYSITVGYELSDKSWWKLFFNILFCRIVIWYVKSPFGEPHVILKHKGYYIDNIQPFWSEITPSKKKFPLIFPIPFIKIFIGYLVKN